METLKFLAKLVPPDIYGNLFFLLFIVKSLNKLDFQNLEGALHLSSIPRVEQ